MVKVNVSYDTSEGMKTKTFELDKSTKYMINNEGKEPYAVPLPEDAIVINKSTIPDDAASMMVWIEHHMPGLFDFSKQPLTDEAAKKLATYLKL